MRGAPVDEAVSALPLQAIAPAAIDVALALQHEITQRVKQVAALRGTQLLRAHYEAELAVDATLKVDPDHLLADALEADWNGRLCNLDASTSARLGTSRGWSARCASVIGARIALMRRPYVGMAGIMEDVPPTLGSCRAGRAACPLPTIARGACAGNKAKQSSPRRSARALSAGSGAGSCRAGI